LAHKPRRWWFPYIRVLVKSRLNCARLVVHEFYLDRFDILISLHYWTLTHKDLFFQFIRDKVELERLQSPEAFIAGLLYWHRLFNLEVVRRKSRISYGLFDESLLLPFCILVLRGIAEEHLIVRKSVLLFILHRLRVLSLVNILLLHLPSASP
jgi:hypothetical protein